MTDTVTVNGSHGSLTVHRSTGFVIHADRCDCSDCAKLGGYDRIRWFDPARWDDCALQYGETDILCTAHVFELPDGRHLYEREASVITSGDDDLPDYHLDFPLLLPAPAAL